MIRNVGFKEVVNIVSANDGVSSILLEPLGRIRNFFDPNTNVRVYGTFSFIKCQSDHLLKGETYMPLLTELGQRFQDEFGV